MLDTVESFDIPNLFSVKDKVVLIVGAGGLGEYLGRGMAKNGAKVVFTNTRIAKAEKVQENMRKDGLDCSIYQLNVTDNDQVNETVAQIASDFGRIDVLINTAGVALHADPENYKPEDVRKIVDINLNGTIFICREVGKVMIKQGGGKIINIGSIAGTMAHTYLSMPYECSKAGVHQLTKSLAVTWAKHNITVNCIAPTWIFTPMNDDFDADMFEKLKNDHPGQRIADVNDFLGLAIYLASEGSNYVTGQIIHVYGGWSAGKPLFIPEDQRTYNW